jgi:hypothetical protein
MKIRLLLIILFAINHLCFSQKKVEFTVLDIPKTIITTEPVFLNVKDTVNKNRSIYKVPEYLGGLKPSYPIATSYDQINGAVYNFIDCLQKFHTLSGHCTNYLIEKDDEIIEINSVEKFKKIYAPVEDKEEALSFAYALCNIPHIRALYDFSFLNAKGTDYEIFRKELKPTSVKELPDGYEVILFSTYWGYTSDCSEVIVYVSKQGDVMVLKNEDLFHDRNFNIIID